ncbi:MAG: indole-3-glycerol-phosphate synthase [Methanomassiliicoccales archaeon]|nr:indole-3-glycerol-phosphate synthase [Methanomassiliicoccales archaeon]
MTDILRMLVRNAHDLVQAGYYDRGGQSCSREAPSFAAALDAHPSFPLIAEVKVASPTRKRISAHAPTDLIRLYKEGGAAGISVVTEPRWFRGDLETLSDAARSGLPVLMKDFVVDGRQIEAAKRLGASAVLLIEDAFEGPSAVQERESLVDLAHGLGLEVLLEAGNEGSLGRATRSMADLIGLNQRDLRSMSVDLDRGNRLLGHLRRGDRPAVVMSGINSRSQVESVRDAGAVAVLIGEAASSSIDPCSFLRSLEVERRRR